MIGDRLRALRVHHDLSLRQLAAETGLSATLLSQVERGVTEPSLKTLRALAPVFGQSVATLFDDQTPVLVHVSRPGERSRIMSPEGQLQYERLTPGNGQLEMLRGVLSPGQASSETAWAHPAIECVYVTDGDLTVEVGDRVVTVAPGESVTLDSNQPHRYMNQTDGQVEFLLAVTPPTP